MKQIEIRLAVVLYGGVSLAVYIHGVTRELLNLIRASQQFHAGRAKPGAAQQSNPNGADDDTTSVYRDLLQSLMPEIDLRVVIDLVSGASAGGINGVMLARSLAHDLPLDAHRDLWLRNADVTQLSAPSSFLSRIFKAPLAPLIDNPYLTAWPGDRMYNWGNKVGTGTRWVLAERRGDWDSIFYSGQEGWFYNPGHKSTRLARATVVTPRAGLATVPVFGVGYPQPAAYVPPKTPVAMEKTYEIEAGQKYVAMQRVTADYYWAKVYVEKDKYGTTADQTVVKDGTEYFLINFNHREALVRVADMEIVRSP